MDHALPRWKHDVTGLSVGDHLMRLRLRKFSLNAIARRLLGFVDQRRRIQMRFGPFLPGMLAGQLFSGRS